MISDACAEISKVATHINECLRQHENFNRMLVIQNSFIGDGAPKILAPGIPLVFVNFLYQKYCLDRDRRISSVVWYISE